MKNLIVILTILVFFIQGCGSEENEVAIGSIYGKIKLYDFFESELEASSLQIEVWKEEILVASKTSIGGSYIIDDLPQGVYDLHFSKNFCGTYKIFDINNNELVTDTIETVSLGQIPPAEINFDRVEFFPSDNPERVGFWHTTYFNHENRFMIRENYYFDTEPDVSFENHKLYASAGRPEGNLDSPLSSAPQFKYQTFYDAGFKSSEKIYVIAYPDNSIFISYKDKNTNRTIFPNVAPPSEIMSFIMP